MTPSAIGRAGGWIGLSLALWPAVQAPAAAQISELAIPTPESGASAIVFGPAGAVWFLESYANRVGRIDSAGAITEIALPGLPEQAAGAIGLAAGPDGNLWIAEQYGSRITRMTPAGVLTHFDLPGAVKEPKGITAGPGGLWFTMEVGNKIGRITTAGVMTEFALPEGFAGLSGITAGPDGNVWFTETARDRIGRITPGGVVTEFTVPTSSAGLAGITTGPDGNLWFAEAGAHKIGRITPAGVITEFPTGSGTRPLSIVAGADGALWFTQNENSMLGRITMQGAITTFPLPTADGRPVGIAAGADGSIWFTAAKSNKIGRYGGSDPEPTLCVATATVLCLADGRFEVSVTWSTPAGASGNGQAVELTDDTGYFWFFNSANVELVLKVLDGRPLTGAWWVFYGALSSVRYTIRVEDMVTGAVKTYENPQGSLASVADTRAIPDAPAFAAFSLESGQTASAAELAVLAGLAGDSLAGIAAPVAAAPAADQSIGLSVAPVTTGNGSPVGSTYEIEALLAIDDGGFLYRICPGAGDFAVTFDTTAESLPAYTCAGNTTPRVSETFTNHQDGTATVELRMVSQNGADLFPGGLFGDGIALGGAALRIGFFDGSNPLDWTPAHTVRTATLDFRSNGSSVFPGGPSTLDPAVFFGAPGAWNGHFGVYYQGRAGDGIDEVILRLTVDHPPDGGGGGGGDDCVADATHLCLKDDRFRVSARWRTNQGTTGDGKAVELTADTGYFWFFNAANVELVLKIIDGHPVTGFWWVFYGALSSVEYAITVEDTETGQVKTYVNTQGRLASVADTQALP